MAQKTLIEKTLERAGDFRRSMLHWWTSEEVAHVLKIDRNDRYSGQRARVLMDTDFTYQEDKIVQQPWNFQLLTMYADYHAFLSIIHGSIIRQVIKRRLTANPNFAKKCNACGHEHQSGAEECVKCGSKDLREPDESEGKRLKALLKDPNRQDEMRQIRESYLRDCLSTGNGYLHKSQLVGSIFELWNEPSPHMFIATDNFGMLGNDIYFCPKCFGSTPEYSEGWPEATARDEFKWMCPFCGSKLEETAYIYKRGQYLTRYTKNEVIHFNSDPRLPNPYGWSKVIALLLQLRSGTAMDKFNYDNYSLIRMAKIIVYEKTTQEQANKVANAVLSQEQELNAKAKKSGIWRKIQRTLHLGSKGGVSVHDAMPDPQKMQSLEWYDYWLVRVIAPQYGVQPIIINKSGSGDQGFSRMEIVVNDNTTELWLTMETDTFNEELIPDLGIHDWSFGYEPIHPTSKRDVALLMSDELSVLEQAAKLGIIARKDDEGNLTWSGEVDMDILREFFSSPTHASQVSEAPEEEHEPRQEGDEGTIPGDDGSGYKPRKDEQ